MVICKIRKITKKDIPILYDLLKYSLSQKYTSVYDNPIPPFTQSEKYVLKFFKNKNHFFKHWYVIINEQNEIMGQVYLQERNYIGYTVFPKYQRKGVATNAIKLLLSKHPRKKYYLLLHNKHIKSINLGKKFGFKPKGLIYEKISK